MIFIFVFVKDICALMGARDLTLVQAERDLCVLFAGAIPIWLANTLISIVRGTGDMRLSSRTVFGISAAQMVIGAALGLGLGPIPQLGMAGVALGQVIAFSVGAIALTVHLLSPKNTRLRLHWKNVTMDRFLFRDILKVGAVSCIGPLQTNLTVMVTTAVIAGFGANALGGYGIGARLEMLLVNIAFGVGVASVPLVGVAIGAGKNVFAKRIAWVAGFTGAVGLGVIGLVMAVIPQTWSSLFTTDQNVLIYANEYLRYSGPAYGFFGLGLCLFFASQGSGNVVGTVLAGTLRLAVVVGACWFLSSGGASAGDYFIVVALGMVCYGLAASLAVKTSRWGW
jgi:Na+-driven multidrug efflux pump